MTREEILAMNPGELNQKVAEEIMGECWHKHWLGDRDSITCLKCGESRFYHQASQLYSTDISAAWRLVEKMFKDGHREQQFSRCHRTGIWEAKFDIIDAGFAESFSLPEAICKAALLAKLGILQ